MQINFTKYFHENYCFIHFRRFVRYIVYKEAYLWNIVIICLYKGYNIIMQIIDPRVFCIYPMEQVVVWWTTSGEIINIYITYILLCLFLFVVYMLQCWDSTRRYFIIYIAAVFYSHIYMVSSHFLFINILLRFLRNGEK